MKYDLVWIMRRAWELHREKGFTLSTSLKLAWAEAKGQKAYAFRLENERASISSYLVKLRKALLAGLEDIHEQHKFDILRAALLANCDSQGIAVMDGKTVGLCKYAVRNA